MNERTEDILYYIHAALSSVMIVILAVANLGAVLLIFSTAKEFHPESTKILDIDGNYTELIPEDTDLSLISWNIGYGGLGEDADYYADGGKKIKTYNQSGVENNLSRITAILGSIHPDFAMLQKVDLDASRSYHTNEMARIEKGLNDYNVSYAQNMAADFIPYPFPPIGKVHSGMMTASKYDVSLATRYSLPSNVSWPQSTVSCKNCLLVSRIQIKNSERELVLINVSLEHNASDGTLSEQMEMLQKLLTNERNSGNYVIAGGDFQQIFSNTDAPNYDYALWKPDTIDISKYPDNLEFYMDEETYSARSLNKPYVDADRNSFQYYIVDGFIVSDNITVSDMHAIDLDFANSNHNPIKLSFSLHDTERDEQELQQALEGIKWNLPSESYYGGEDSGSDEAETNRRNYYNTPTSPQAPTAPTAPSTPTSPTAPSGGSNSDSGSDRTDTGDSSTGGSEAGGSEETGGSEDTGGEDTGGDEDTGGSEETGGGETEE